MDISHPMSFSFPDLVLEEIARFLKLVTNVILVIKLDKVIQMIHHSVAQEGCIRASLGLSSDTFLPKLVPR